VSQPLLVITDPVRQHYLDYLAVRRALHRESSDDHLAVLGFAVMGRAPHADANSAEESRPVGLGQIMKTALRHAGRSAQVYQTADHQVGAKDQGGVGDELVGVGEQPVLGVSERLDALRPELQERERDDDQRELDRGRRNYRRRPGSQWKTYQ
jgi:hypothetical protein